MTLDHISISTLTRRVTAVALLFAATSGVASPPAGTTTLVYDFSRSGMSLAEMTDTLHVRGREYELTSNAKGVGIVALLARGQTLRRESRGTIGAEGLQPKSFVEERGANYRLSAEFDWTGRQVTLTDAKGERSQETLADAKGERSQEPLAVGTQDRMSMPYQVAFMPGAPPAELSIQVADGRRLSGYAFKLVGTETVTVGIGDIKALHYAKVATPSDPTAFDLWLGIDQQLLPVRVSYADKDGARYEQSLRSLHADRP